MCRVYDSGKGQIDTHTHTVRIIYLFLGYDKRGQRECEHVCELLSIFALAEWSLRHCVPTEMKVRIIRSDLSVCDDCQPLSVYLNSGRLHASGKRNRICCRRQHHQWRNSHEENFVDGTHMHTHAHTIEFMTWQCRIMEYSLIFWVIMLCIFNTFWQWFTNFFFSFLFLHTFVPSFAIVDAHHTVFGKKERKK